LCLVVTIVAVLITLHNPSAIALAAEPRTRVYSDVRHIVEVDDYVGDEVVICFARTGPNVTGQWDLYQGYDPALTLLAGTLVGSRLEMQGSDANGPISLVAVLSRKALRGTLTWHIGDNLHTKDINLKRVSGRLVDLRRRGATVNHRAIRK